MLRLQRLAAERVGEEHVVIVEDAERQVRRVALLRCATTNFAVRAHLGPLAGSSWIGTPSQSVSSFVQRVTQWMSVWTVLRGSALNGFQVSENGESTSP